jgi:hypothetical protein
MEGTMAFGINWRAIGWGFLGALLLLPLVAMQFTDEVKWTLSDFVFMGMLFGAVGLGFELVVRKSKSLWYRAGAVLAVLTAFFLVWVNAAVGIIGEDHPVNLMFPGVVFLGLAGAVVARFEAAGMARAMSVAAAAQALTPAAAWPIAPGMRGELMTPRVLILIGAFALLLAGSALLFRRAAATSAPAP